MAKGKTKGIWDPHRILHQQDLPVLLLVGLGLTLLINYQHKSLYHHMPVKSGRGKHPHAPDTGTVPGDTGTYSSAPIRKVKFS